MDVVDGYSVVEQDDGDIRLTFSDRYGEAECFIFPPEDALKIANALWQCVQNTKG